MNLDKQIDNSHFNRYQLLCGYALLILFAFLFLSCTSKARFYCSEADFTACCYKFQGKDRFTYDWASCTISEQGQGTYSIRGDTIIFYYDELSELSERAGDEITMKKIAGSDDSIHIDLKVVQLNGVHPVPQFNAAIFQAGVLIEGKEGDYNGQTRINLPYIYPGYDIELLSYPMWLARVFGFP